MFHEDGTMKKSCKSDLVKQFENEVSPVLSLPDFDPSLTTYIRNSMALVQCMDAKKHRTFGELATDYCRQLTSCFAKIHTVADVFDRYDVKNSIKSVERERRTYQSDCPYKGVPSHRRQKYS
jgi:cell division FtsZ-interacting protein ZapD